ncbi:MAG: hypothetical protein QOG99_1807, partial [Frankiales bacterium]|nr:hypothetical protein [Frankiales bacterium]
MLRVRLGIAGTLAVVAVLSAAGAAQARAASSDPTGSGAQVPVLRWSRCPGQKGFQCASARVPLSYEHPDGAQIRLAVMRHRATDPHRELGTLFLNPGGPAPAKPSFPFVYALFPQAVRERFDIVTWDPRGLGESNPVTCFSSSAAEDRFLAKTGLPVRDFPRPDSQIDPSLANFAELDRRCLHRSGRELLEHMSTADSARDLDLLRRAFGEPKVNYYGGSYGTLLGDTYANLFPGRVRRMVLDANVSPIKWFSRGAGAFPDSGGTFLPTFLRQGSDLGARKTLNAFLDLCGETSTKRCAFSAGSAAATRAKFASLLQRLQLDPWPGAPTYGDVVSEAVEGVYTVSAWGVLASRLEEEWDGLTPAPIAAPPGPHPSFAGPYGIFCGEVPNPG